MYKIPFNVRETRRKYFTKLANERAGKALFTFVVYTKNIYGIQ